MPIKRKSHLDDLYYRDNVHRDIFKELIINSNKIFNVNGKRIANIEYAMAFYIMSSDSIIRDSSLKYINDIGIDFPTMLQNPYLQLRQIYLLKIAWNLFNGGTTIDIREIIYLDKEGIQVMLQAIELLFQNLELD